MRELLRGCCGGVEIYTNYVVGRRSVFTEVFRVVVNFVNMQGVLLLIRRFFFFTNYVVVGGGYINGSC